ncbi:LytR C-terminal domain-containing protein [Micrococcus porci]|nr:LytR C-terminal domain-containing protein [Micrococcus porci]
MKSTPVNVYNATRRNGLAASYADRLTGAGYTRVTADNWPGFRVTSNTVMYNGADKRAAAEAVGRELGMPVQQVPNLQVPGIAVVVVR